MMRSPLLFILGSLFLFLACEDKSPDIKRSVYRFTLEQSGDINAFRGTISYQTELNTTSAFFYPDSVELKVPKNITVDSTTSVYKLQTKDSVKAFFVGYTLNWKKGRNKTTGWDGDTLRVLLQVWEDDVEVFSAEDTYVAKDTIKTSWNKEVILNASN